MDLQRNAIVFYWMQYQDKANQAMRREYDGESGFATVEQNAKLPYRHQ